MLLALRPAVRRSLLLAILPAAAHAQTNPLQTEEATTAPARTLRLETLGELIAGEPNPLTGHTRARFAGPTLRLVYSPAANVEMDLEWVAIVATPNDPDFGGVADAGDVSLRAKLRLLKEASSRPAVSARFAVTLPETSFGNGLGPNTLRMFAEALLSRSRGPWTLHLNAGLFLFDEVLRPHEQRDFTIYGIALLRRLRGFSLLAELAGRAGSGAPGANATAEVRAGFRKRWRGLEWGAAMRRGLLAVDGSWGVVAGAGFALRPARRSGVSSPQG